MSKEDSLKEFNIRCGDLESCKFLVSAQRVSNLLKLLAGDPVLYDFLGECMKDFYFESEFEKSVVETANGKSFKLPFNKRRLVAFVTCLLYEFDSGRKSIVDFLNEYFPSNSINASYEAFCEEVIKPYGAAVNSVLTGARDPEEEADKSVKVDKVNDVSDGAVTQTEYILRAMNAIVMEDETLSKGKRDDYLAIIDGLNYALELRDSRLVKCVYTAFRYAFSQYKAVDSKVSDVGACLKLYLII